MMSRVAMNMILVVTTLLCVFSTASYGRVMVGAKTEVTEVEKNREVQELGRFAVEEYNQNNNQNGGLKFVKVVEAEQQVVSGIKYYLNISASDVNGVDRMFTSVVVVKPWLHHYKKLIHFGPLSTTTYHHDTVNASVM